MWAKSQKAPIWDLSPFPDFKCKHIYICPASCSNEVIASGSGTGLVPRDLGQTQFSICPQPKTVFMFDMKTRFAGWCCYQICRDEYGTGLSNSVVGGAVAVCRGRGCTTSPAQPEPRRPRLRRILKRIRQSSQSENSGPKWQRTRKHVGILSELNWRISGKASRGGRGGGGAGRLRFVLHGRFRFENL